MRVCRLTIKNFRSVKVATMLLPRHAVLIGDNNTGKTTLLEALDLVLGPDRLNRQPPIDEHDFFRGEYLAKVAAVAEAVVASTTAAAPPAPAVAGTGAAAAASPSSEVAPHIEIEAAITELSEEQKSRFGDHIEFWDGATDTFYSEPKPEGIDPAHIAEALRVTFLGRYNAEEDDFEGKTYFSRSLDEGGAPEQFDLPCFFGPGLA